MALPGFRMFATAATVAFFGPAGAPKSAKSSAARSGIGAAATYALRRDEGLRVVHSSSLNEKVFECAGCNVVGQNKHARTSAVLRSLAPVRSRMLPAHGLAFAAHSCKKSVVACGWRKSLVGIEHNRDCFRRGRKLIQCIRKRSRDSRDAIGGPDCNRLPSIVVKKSGHWMPGQKVVP